VYDSGILFVLFCRIIDETTKAAAAVDPVEPEKVLAAASEVGAYIDCVLTTHHHWYAFS
jgi:hydroxyacylglutathione hydrolase